MGPPRYWKSPTGPGAGSSESQKSKARKADRKTRLKRPREPHENDQESGSPPKRVFKFRSTRSTDIAAPVYTRSKSPDKYLPSNGSFTLSGTISSNSSSTLPKSLSNDFPRLRINEPSSSKPARIGFRMKKGYADKLAALSPPTPITANSYTDPMRPQPYQPYQSVFQNSKIVDQKDKPETVSRNFVSYSPEVMALANLETTADDDGTFSFTKLLKTPNTATASSSSTSLSNSKSNVINRTIDLCVDSDDEEDSVQILSTEVSTASSKANQKTPEENRILITKPVPESSNSNVKTQPLPNCESTLMSLSNSTNPPFTSPKVQYLHNPKLIEEEEEVIPIDLISDDDDCKVVGIVTPATNRTRYQLRNRSSIRKSRNVLTPTSHNNFNSSKFLAKKLLKRFGKTRWNTPPRNQNHNELIHRRKSKKSLRKSRKKNKVVQNQNSFILAHQSDDTPDSIPRNRITYGKPRPIVIDGSNVAMRFGNGKFVCKGIEICVRHFQTQAPFKDHPTEIIVFVPQYRTKSNQSIGTEILLKLEKEGIVKYTPSREVDGLRIASYDDRFILKYAVMTGAIVVSNDNFRDLYQDEPEWRDTIKNRILPFTWAGNILMFPDDPLGKLGPRLCDFIRFEAGDPMENSTQIDEQ